MSNGRRNNGKILIPFLKINFLPFEKFIVSHLKFIATKEE